MITVFSLEQFTVPSVSGQCCPPIDSFIIEKITTTGNRGVIFGGKVTVSGDRTTSTNSVYIFSVTHSIIVSCIYFVVLYSTVISLEDILCCTHINCILCIIILNIHKTLILHKIFS